MSKKDRYLLIGGGIALIIFIIVIGSISSSSAKAKSELQKEIETQQSLVKERDLEIVELNKKVEEAKPWFELQEKERQEKIAEAEAKEAEKKAEEKAKADAEKAEKEKKAAAAKKEEEKIAAEKAAKEAAAEVEAKKKAEEEERIGYDTGITYNQLARTPDDFEFEKVKFRGKVIQVIEGDGETQIRLAVNDNYDTILYAAYESDIVKSRILEDDMITIMGISGGLLSYESTNGGTITIPMVYVEIKEDKIQLSNPEIEENNRIKYEGHLEVLRLQKAEEIRIAKEAGVKKEREKAEEIARLEAVRAKNNAERIKEQNERGKNVWEKPEEAPVIKKEGRFISDAERLKRLMKAFNGVQ
ncbi:hypothetical protein JSQ81_16950 [Sporosarcina sp. Marseille-Q4063]|uniref:hypothetical protein n=1 Tax=Sporosarcina sp. Marseille-Q4063 TaxID=2810514 RepID=UPI001BAF6E1A|nr:hypothetical protein JSQ81_16950 [Sporosarcina sp. Marseille-Q4063]